ncbi:PadR family transcriptional regulator [Asticcacaulis sp. SL142]|uniref:PadR family transcriptional regulator n=1 Tax=Asticcacaulis sp. SL142 TaxID=2995155 RepID=UPI00226D34A0|nr:PadR family transcriptional regulator [Asticcacaulis sp. SL142]WAC49423.1 PadR family transcriptional regulator [Asticcacaulis sp. SL142]
MTSSDKTSDTRRTQLYKGVLDLALLSLLDEGPQYGLRILDQLREGAGLDLSEGTLYPLLHRLNKAGLILSEWRHEADASHPRKYYALTAQGQAELVAQRHDWLNLTQNLNAFLLRRSS